MDPFQDQPPSASSFNSSSAEVSISKKAASSASSTLSIDRSFEFEDFLLKDPEGTVSMMLCPCHVLYVCPSVIDRETGEPVGKWTYFSIITYHYIKFFNAIQGILELIPPVHGNLLPDLQQKLTLAHSKLYDLEMMFQMYQFNTTRSVLDDYPNDTDSAARLVHSLCNDIGIDRTEVDKVSSCLKDLEDFIRYAPRPSSKDPQVKNSENLRDCGLAVHKHALLTLNHFDHLIGSWQHEADCKNALNNYQTMLTYQKHDIQDPKKKSSKSSLKCINKAGESSRKMGKKVWMSFHTTLHKCLHKSIDAITSAAKLPGEIAPMFSNGREGYHQMKKEKENQRPKPLSSYESIVYKVKAPASSLIGNTFESMCTASPSKSGRTPLLNGCDRREQKRLQC
jgi:hypothetical protein